MEETQPLQGRVAAVLNTRELAINIGSQAGVQIGMKFQVLHPEENVSDPDTQEIIGHLQREKIRVKVVEVRERMAICSTYETFQTGGTAPVSTLMGLPLTHVRTLDSNDALFRSFTPGVATFVRVADPVIQVLDED